MSRFIVLVAGEDVGEALAPFYEYLEVAPYRRACLCERALPACRFCRGSGVMESDRNPAGRWDSWVTTAGHFVRRPGAKPLRGRGEYEGLCFAPSWIGDSSLHFPQRLDVYLADTDWDQARYGDLELDAIRAAGFLPYAAVVGGRWHQSDKEDWFPGTNEVTNLLVFPDDWPTHFEDLLSSFGPDELITLVSCHG